MVAGYEDLSSDEEMAFENQLSIEGDDFDDLSEDERPKMIEDSEGKKSIIQQVKTDKQKNRNMAASYKNGDGMVNDSVVHADITQELNVDEVEVYDDLDGAVSSADKHEVNQTNTNTDSHLSKNINEISESNSKQITHINEDVVEGDEEDENVYVISADVDIDDDWMKNNESENGSDSEEEQATLEYKVSFEQSFNKSFMIV